MAFFVRKKLSTDEAELSGDALLVDRAKNGDSEAYGALVEKYSSFVPGLHGPGSSVSRSDHRVNIDLNIPSGVDFSVLPTKTTGEDYPNVYPAHVLLAVMLYIGRKES